jgi:hypothetical protein
MKAGSLFEHGSVPAQDRFILIAADADHGGLRCLSPGKLLL